jgi:hypothetical protein
MSNKNYTAPFTDALARSLSAERDVIAYRAMYYHAAKLEEDAIAAGVAEYVVDPKTGETTFQFKEVKP